ncbi:MAG: tetratricopeptide repeat protein [Acidobacteria bacterium]|nr:tetratricopeptide repeat protein [Acidobacteriota bacterium]
MLERMKTPLLTSLLVAALAAPAMADKKDDMLLQIQRDLALLQEALRQSDRAQGERIAALDALLKQNLEQTTRLKSALDVIERAVNKQSDAILPPVTRTAAKVDALTDQFGGLRDAVEESNSMLTRLMQEVSDLKTHMTTLPPPGFGATPGAEGAAAPEDSGDGLFTSGFTDYSRGNYDLAKAELTDFLRYYSASSRASEAQYYLGAIAYEQGDLEGAVKEFNLVLERYPVGHITPDAQYKKGVALEKLGRRDAAIQEYQALLTRFPNASVSENARGAIERLQGGGLAGDPGSKPSPLRP